MGIPGYETKQTTDATAQFSTVIYDWLEKALAGGAQDQEQLKTLLEKKHSEYNANIEEWRKAGDVGLMRIRDVVAKKKYLVQGVNEGNDAFDKRATIAAFTPELPGLLNDFIGAVFGVEAVREISESAKGYADKFSTFTNGAGEDGSPLSSIARDALRLCLTYNRVLGVLDHPSDRETETPNLFLRTPEDLYDWAETTDGRYEWAKFHECRKQKASWDAKEVTVDEYRIYLAPRTVELEDGGVVVTERGRIITYRRLNAEGQKEVIVGPEVIEHAFPHCPVVPMILDKTGQAWAAPLVEKDLKTFRIEADHAFSMFNTANPTLLAWMHGPTQEAFDRIKRGSEKAIHLNPGTSDEQPENIAYIQNDVASLDHLSAQAKENRDATRRLAGTGSDTENDAGNTGNPESGVAKAYAQAQKEKNYKTAAHSLAKFEKTICELVLLEGSQDDEIEDGVINIRYPSSFDMRNTQELGENLLYSREIGSATLEIEVKKKLAAKILGDGADSEMIEKINKEIEAAPTAEDIKKEEAENGDQTSVDKPNLPVRK